MAEVRQLPLLSDGNPQSVEIQQEWEVYGVSFVQDLIQRVSSQNPKPLTDDDREHLKRGIDTFEYVTDRITAALNPAALTQERWDEVSKQSTFRYIERRGAG